MASYGEMLVGGGIGILNSYLSNKWAQEREAEAREQNYKYGEQAADNADLRTRALYEDYQSPKALLEQYKDAGLSPSLMFANGAAGAGGMTQGAQGAGASGIAPTTYGAGIMEGAQLALMQAQARKTNAEADTLEGKNDRGQAEISQLQESVKKTIEETKNVGLKNAWYEYENALQEIKVSYDASTLDKKIENFLTECKYLEHKTRSAKVKAEIDEKTQEDVMNLVHENLKNVIADTFLKNAQRELAKMQKKGVEKQIEVSDKQIEDLISQIENRGKQTDINRDTLNQEIKEWSLKNGLIIGNDELNLGHIWERLLYGEKGQDLMVELIKAFLKS